MFNAWCNFLIRRPPADSSRFVQFLIIWKMSQCKHKQYNPEKKFYAFIYNHRRYSHSVLLQTSFHSSALESNERSAQPFAFKREKNPYTKVLFLLSLLPVLFERSSPDARFELSNLFWKNLKAYSTLFLSSFQRVYNRFISRF